MAEDRAWITVLLVLLAVLVIWILVTLVISGAAKLGYALFNLNLVDGKKSGCPSCFPSSIGWATAS